MSQFIDEVEIEIVSGDGGNGMVAWRREKYEPLGGPAGGDGGRGGSVYLQATRDQNTLLDFKYKKRFEADRGQKGRSKSMHGKSADNLIIKVPVGTCIFDGKHDIPIADLVHHGQRIMVAEGGKGGRGNAALATHRRKAPHFCEPGQSGIKRLLRLELKLLADVGLVGLPNAGKSTLLRALSNARPKVGDYPFTTLVPSLGVVAFSASSGGNRDGFVMADIPGLIEGASEGIGLGHRFLKHIERTLLLVHLVDAASDDISASIKTIDRELDLYAPTVSGLPQLIAINKIDLLDKETLESVCEKVRENFPERQVLAISAATRSGCEELVAELGLMISKLSPEQDALAVDMELEPDPGSRAREEDSFSVLRKRGVFTVVGDRVERIVSVTNLRDPESLTNMYHRLRGMGVIDNLLAEGIEPGMDVIIGGVVFSYGEDW